MDAPLNPGIAALYLEDFAVGDRYRSSAVTVTESQIINYALSYDPQPFHVSAVDGRGHPFGSVFASGLHTVALSFRLFAESRVLAACAYAGLGIEKLRWLRPVMPGDSLHLEVEVLAVRPSETRPGLGVLVLRHDTVNQDGERVLTLECTHMVRRRPSG